MGLDMVRRFGQFLITQVKGSFSITIKYEDKQVNRGARSAPRKATEEYPPFQDNFWGWCSSHEIFQKIFRKFELNVQDIRMFCQDIFKIFEYFPRYFEYIWIFCQNIRISWNAVSWLLSQNILDPAPGTGFGLASIPNFLIPFLRFIGNSPLSDIKKFPEMFDWSFGVSKCVDFGALSTWKDAF